MEKLCKDRLVGKLATIAVATLLVAGNVTVSASTQDDNTLAQKLLTLSNGYASAQIDDAVSEARKRLTYETKQARRGNDLEELEKLFDSQIANLKSRRVPKQIIDMFLLKKDDVLIRMLVVWQKYNFEPLDSLASRGIHLAIPVIPRSFRGPHDLMAMVRNGNKVGYTYLNPTQIFDVVETPSEPYYIYDIEDGSATRGKSPQDAEKTLKLQKRFPLTAAEVMALATHTSVLSKHYMWAIGSRYGSAGKAVLIVRLDYDVWPRLLWLYIFSSDDRWGSPSCGSR